jgi:hypothetical protein
LKALAAALVKAQLAAEAVGKDKANAFHKYKYASAEAMLAEGREAITGAGLALFQLGWVVSADLAKMTVHYLLLEHTSGENVSWDAETSIIPDKGRPQDKAEAAALTYSIAYTIRGLLLLPRVDESASVDTRDDSRHGRRPAGHDRQRLTRATPDGEVLDGPMPFTHEAPSPQVVAAIKAAKESDMRAVIAWVQANREDLHPDDYELYRTTIKARAPKRPEPPPLDADAATKAAAEAHPLTAEEQAALDANADDDTSEPETT